jgi:hypothetical protein
MAPPPRRVTLKKVLLFGVLLLCLGACLVVLPCAQKIRDGAGWQRSAFSLRGIGLALYGYHDVYGKLPPAVVTSKVGPGTAFERAGLTLKDFPDGVENALLVVEAAEPVPWSKPADLVYDPDGPLPPLGCPFSRPVHFLCYEVYRKPGFNAVFGDGSSRFIDSRADEKTLRGLITRNGGEKVDLSKLD